ncbi:MAG: GspE/PulE family protein, partial [Planctomycetota bacterium]|nr:GspE/PulE family protein [Planctomycetota bacterium]
IESVSVSFDEPADEEEDDKYELSALGEDPPIIRLVNSVLAQAIKLRASDIHFQPEPEHISVRFRVDGVMQDGPELPSHLNRSIAARLKVMSQLDITENRLPHDGRISLKVANREYLLRLSIVPSMNGTSAVIRIAEQAEDGLSISSMGMNEDTLMRFKHVVECPLGLVLITGPTGSGKSTTLYSSLSHLNQADKKIITIEDPVERQIAGLTQIETNDGIGLAFADGLRSALRHNPDVIMVGEIRDKETADIAVQASLTGHLVFSTIHTNDAASAVTRLVNMGVEPFLVGSSLSAAMAQRLVRSLCPDCKIPVQDEGSVLAPFGVHLKTSITVHHASGCSKCGASGYRGRAPVFELLLNSANIEELITANSPDSVIRKLAIEEGMRTLQHEVAEKVMDGTTSLQEALRTIQSEWASKS